MKRSHLKTTKNSVLRWPPSLSIQRTHGGTLWLIFALLVSYLTSHSYCLKILLTTLFGTHTTSPQGSALLNRIIMQACLNQSNSVTCILFSGSRKLPRPSDYFRHWVKRSPVPLCDLCDLLWLSVTFCHSSHSYHNCHSSGYSCYCGYSRFSLTTPNASLIHTAEQTVLSWAVETEFLLVLLAIFVCFLALHLLGTDLGLRGLCPLH